MFECFYRFQSTVLQGYGVFLDIKKMEYKNDETDIEDKENDKDNESDKEKEKNKDEKEEIVESVSDVKEVRKIRDLGLQSLSSIVNAQVCIIH